MLVLGRAGRSYVVENYRRTGLVDVLLVARDGTRRTLVTGVDGSQLSPDRTLLVTSKVVRFRTEVRVLQLPTGRVVARRTLGDAVWAVDMDERRVLLGGVGGASGGTHLWNHRTGRVKRLSSQSAYAADLGTGVYARRTDDADQYEGGCTVVARVGSGKELWRSCGEIVSDFSPDGRSMLVSGYDSPSARVRTVRGVPVVRYRVRYPEQYEYLEWGTDGRVLLHLLDEDDDSVLVACAGLECTRVP